MKLNCLPGFVFLELLESHVSEVVHGKVVALLSLDVLDVVRQDRVHVLSPHFLGERVLYSCLR